MTETKFLVIGAMKSATTTLFHDLATNPAIRCCEKESGILLDSVAASSDLKSRFDRETRASDEAASSTPIQAVGEICTKYSMLPDIQNVPQRALKVFGNDLKIIYLVRDPILRTLSHHQHLFNWHGEGQLSGDINAEIKTQPRLIDYSKYFMQLEPWIQAFGLDSIKVIRFEDFVAHRRDTLEDIRSFLNVETKFGELNDAGANRGGDRLVAGRNLLRLYHTDFFRRTLKPLVPDRVRGVLRKVLLRKARPAATPPNSETIATIHDRVRDDSLKLAEVLQQNPLWDLEKTCRQLNLKTETVNC